MTQAWVTLTRADGHDIASPSEQQIATALSELYTAPRAAETASAVLRFGYDDGLMYVAEVNSAGELRFEEWSDSDCELALAAPRSMQGSKEQAQQLWNMMSRRQVSKIRELAWQSGN
jgi:DsbC/DsbD-like thiol-disulfide interchange protein